MSLTWKKLILDADLSGYLQNVVEDTTPQLGGDLDFQQYKAIAMVCDNGSTVPTSPVAGQWFLHTPTGRKVLMQYTGSAWQPIISIGTMTMYVDSTGTDGADYGTGTGSNAFLTIQYAVNQIPPLYSGDVKIYVAAGTYNETVTIRGKKPTGSFYFNIYGTLTQLESWVATGGGKGATTTRANVTGTFTPNAYDNKLIYFTSGSNNGLYRIIDEMDASNIYLAGRTLYVDPAVDDTYKIYDWGTIVTQIVVDRYQEGVSLIRLKITRTSSPLSLSSGASVTVYQSWILATASGGLGAYATGFVFLTTYDCLFEASGGGGCRIYAFYDSSVLVILGGKIKGADTGVGIYLESLAGSRLESTFIVDVGTGIQITGASVVKLYCASVYNRITSCPTYGIRADLHGEAFFTSSVVFTSNGVDVSNVAASYGYIDSGTYYQYTTSAKTADYTCLYTDSNKVFTDKGAGAARTFTLPAVTYTGWTATFIWVSGYAMIVQSAEGDNMVLFNDASADSISFATAGEIIGNSITVVSDGAKWLVQVNLATETATPTIVT